MKTFRERELLAVPDSLRYIRNNRVIKQTDDCNGFSLAPNPATTAITLQATGAYRITDMLGRELLQGTLADKKQTIDIGTLPEGNYIVSFKEDGNKTVYRKFTKL